MIQHPPGVLRSAYVDFVEEALHVLRFVEIPVVEQVDDPRDVVAISRSVVASKAIKSPFALLVTFILYAAIMFDCAKASILTHIGADLQQQQQQQQQQQHVIPSDHFHNADIYVR